MPLSEAPMRVSPPYPILNERLSGYPERIFAGDYEVVGPYPWLGQKEVRSLGTDLVLLHYHHRHEFVGGHRQGLWGNVQQAPGRYSWSEVDRLVNEAVRRFPMVGLYPVGWAHMVPKFLGRTILEISPDVIAEWVATVVERYQETIAVFPIFYEMNVFDLFYRATDTRHYATPEKMQIVDILWRCHEAVRARSGEKAASRLTAGTFVELTRSSFYWMSEGKLLELPHGSALIEAALAPPDLLRTARALDVERGGNHVEHTIRQLLHQIIFWNADDSGADNTLGDDLRRLVSDGWVYDQTLNPEGFVHVLLPGWDAQPQNTYQHLSARIAPERYVASAAECLQRHHESLERFLSDPSVPKAYRDRIIGFVLDDVFKCQKQSGITSAVYPTETIDAQTGQRRTEEPVYVSALGKAYHEIIRNCRARSTTGHPPSPVDTPAHIQTQRIRPVLS
ncbi:MAG: hypothetical protein ACYDDA_01395 [Acidiferrobacteraceae bacterium]